MIVESPTFDRRPKRSNSFVPLLSLTALITIPAFALQAANGGEPALTLPVEETAGEGVWVQPFNVQRPKAVVTAKVWFDRQFLGSGTSYEKRSREFADARRRTLRVQVMKTLKSLSDQSFGAAKGDLDQLAEQGVIHNLTRHWIINGFSCTIAIDGLDKLKKVPGVKKIFLTGPTRRNAAAKQPVQAPGFEPVERGEFDPARYKHPWYVRYLMADKVWMKFGVAGQGTLNVIHDFNFVFSDNTTYNLYRNPNEVPSNRKDDDGNGLVDDYHG